MKKPIPPTKPIKFWYDSYVPSKPEKISPQFVPLKTIDLRLETSTIDSDSREGEISYLEFVERLKVENEDTKDLKIKVELGIDWGYYDDHDPKGKLIIGKMEMKNNKNYTKELEHYNYAMEKNKEGNIKYQAELKIYNENYTQYVKDLALYNKQKATKKKSK